jgi:hypothetical protein
MPHSISDSFTGNVTTGTPEPRSAPNASPSSCEAPLVTIISCWSQLSVASRTRVASLVAVFLALPTAASLRCETRLRNCHCHCGKGHRGPVHGTGLPLPRRARMKPAPTGGREVERALAETRGTECSCRPIYFFAIALSEFSKISFSTWPRICAGGSMP